MLMISVISYNNNSEAIHLCAYQSHYDAQSDQYARPQVGYEE